MHAGKRVRVDSSDVSSSYSHGFTVTSGRLIGFRIEIFRNRTSSGELIGCFWMRSCIDAVILIGFLYLEFGKLLVMPRCYCSGSIGQGNLYPQPRE
ncbi:hypothetical protein Gogos_021233 [Gossypium gossypioides]|uniref:Uncharacterized protein n=1 Tax=Gossypium gossypioides TaxID=34282 RepID=A0A7J9D6P2_GOSGO|nr:hypothetical protein [Gossypium gossypioides]